MKVAGRPQKNLSDTAGPPPAGGSESTANQSSATHHQNFGRPTYFLANFSSRLLPFPPNLTASSDQSSHRLPDPRHRESTSQDGYVTKTNIIFLNKPLYASGPFCFRANGSKMCLRKHRALPGPPTAGPQDAGREGDLDGEKGEGRGRRMVSRDCLFPNHPFSSAANLSLSIPGPKG